MQICWKTKKHSQNTEHNTNIAAENDAMDDGCTSARIISTENGERQRTCSKISH